MDVRLREYPWKFDGREWTLRCNMNVLAELQVLNDGELAAVLSGKRTMTSILQVLAVMLNDDAKERGLEVRYTPRQVGKLLPFRAFRAVSPKVMDLVIRAVEDDEAEQEPADEKNAETSEDRAAASTSAGT